MEMKITVSKAEMLERLMENREKHRETFLAALEGYRKYAMRILDEQIRALADGRTPEIRIIVDRPVDHTRDYDRIIGMLNMHQGNVFELDEQSYAQYMDDDWSWKRQWLTASTQYAPDSVYANYGHATE